MGFSIKQFLFLLFSMSSLFLYAQRWDEVNEKALNYHNDGEYEQASKYYEEGLMLAKKEFGVKSTYYSTALNNYALLYIDLGEFQKAEEFLLEALSIRKKIYGEKNQKYSHTLGCLGSCYQGMGKYNLSEEYYLKAMFIDSIIGGTETDEYASGLSNIGLLYQLMGQFNKSESCLLRAVEIRKKIRGSLDRGYIVSVGNLALLYLELGKYDESEKRFLEVLEADKKLLGEDHPDYATDLINMGALYSDVGDMIKAEGFYLRSMAIWKKVVGEMSQQYASVLNNLAMLYNDLGYQEKSEELYLKCVQIGEEVWGNGHPEYATYLNNLANLYSDMGRTEEAENLFLKSARIRKATLGEDHPDYAGSLNSLASIYFDREEYDRAEDFYIAALDIIIKKYGQYHPQVGSILSNLGLLYSTTGQFDKVEEIYLISSTIIKESSGENSYSYVGNLWGIARMYRMMERYGESETYYRQADTLSRRVLGTDHLDYAKIIHGYGILKHEMKDTVAAGQLFRQSDSLFLAHLQKLFRFTTEDEKTKGLFSIINYLNRSHSFYFLFNKSHPDYGKNALNLHLTTNGLVLSSTSKLREEIFSEGGDSIQQLYAVWEKYNKIISKELSKPTSSRSAKLISWQEEKNRIEKQLNKVSNTFQSSLDAVLPDFDQLRNSLKKNEAAVEFVSFAYSDGIAGTNFMEYVAIVVTPESPIPFYVPLFEEKQLAGLINGDSIRMFANLLYSGSLVRGVEHDISYGDSLYQLVWKPIENIIKGKTDIYYGPSGLLHTLNFDAIPKNSSQTLSDVFQLYRTTSTATLIGRKNAPFVISSVALFGGIQYSIEEDELKKLGKTKDKTSKADMLYADLRSTDDSTSRSGFNYLPGSKTEVENISQITQKNQVKTSLYAGMDANEESVKNLNNTNSPSIIHFSTHGFFIPEKTKQSANHQNNVDEELVFTTADDPLFRSGLIMAGADYVWKGNPPINGIEDGILTAYEVSNLYFPNTRLVVMSACETGLGDIKGSEGVYGLQRAFKMAGVDYMIVSLWKVLDKETSEFMTLFYQNLIIKKSITEAFKITQDTMKNKYRSEPYKWAGFVLIG